jgi:aryl-alcohol dehydrogenase-like predicted oxidoreductase
MGTDKGTPGDAMHYTQFGPTGLRVSELCLGTMTFGEEWGWGADAETSRRIFDRFVAAGGNFVDTANVYTNGTSEKLVGEFVHAERSRFVVGTKYSLSMRSNDPNGGGNQRKNLVQSVEASLRSMRLEYIDILWVHAWDFLTPEEEVMRSLDDMVRAGKILYTGISDTPAWIISRSNAIADLRGWTAFAGVQFPYSLIERTPEREFLPMARSLGLSIAAWGSLGGGILTGKYRGKTSSEVSGRLLIQQGSDARAASADDRTKAIVDALCRIAGEVGCTPGQAALAWVMGRNVPIVPLLGARTEDQIRDNLGCLTVQLSGDQIGVLDAASNIELGFPHDFINSPAMVSAVHGEMLPAIRPRRWYGR